MNDRARPSAEALAFLSAERPRLPSLNADSAWAFREAIKVDTIPRAERALARHDVTVETSTCAGVRCLVVTPDGWDAGPEAMYCFGGGFFSGSPREDLILAAPLAAYSGTRITMVDYRLAPENPYPAAIEDGFAVYREMVRNGTFRLIGESAGGNLALALLQRARHAGLVLPDKVALMSPWCDLTPDGVSVRNADGDDPTLNPEMSMAATAMYAGKTAPEDPNISPLFADWSGTLPQFMITTGTRDLLHTQVLRLVDRLHGAAVRKLRVHPQLWHVFEFYDEIPEADQSLREIAAFLR